MFTPPTSSELHNGYSAEKLKILKDHAIYDVDKLVYGKNYALLSNGYYLGTYESNQIVAHTGKCGCHDTVYKFTQLNPDGSKAVDWRGSPFIKEIGVYNVTY